MLDRNIITTKKKKPKNKQLEGHGGWFITRPIMVEMGDLSPEYLVGALPPPLSQTGGREGDG